MRKLIRLILINDFVAATLVILAVTFITACFWLVISWLVYYKRYGTSFSAYIEMLF